MEGCGVEAVWKRCGKPALRAATSNRLALAQGGTKWRPLGVIQAKDFVLGELHMPDDNMARAWKQCDAACSYVRWLFACRHFEVK